MITEVIFDLETKKLFNEISTNDPTDLGVSIVSVYKRSLDNNFQEIEGKMHSFWDKDISKMWGLFEAVDRVIGFNTLKFDIPALKTYAPFPFSKLNHFDIMQKIKDVLGHRISLDAISRETLNREKMDIGIKAVYYWQQGDQESLKKLKKYCEDDVLITRNVYDFGLKEGYLKYTDKWNTPRKIEIDFSYPKEEISTKQTALF